MCSPIVMMDRRLNFLLFLSAMLSALTGVVTAGRAVAPQALSQAIIEAATEPRQSAVIAVPREAIAALVVAARAPIQNAFFPALAEPLFASRRRE